MTPSNPTRPTMDDTTQHQIDAGPRRASAPEVPGVSKAIGGRRSDPLATYSRASVSGPIGSQASRSLQPPTAPPRSRTSQRAPVDIDAALDVCERITRADARGLYQSMESLTAYRRRAL